MDGTVPMGADGCERAGEGGDSIDLLNSLPGFELDRVVVTVGDRTLFSTNDKALLGQARLTVLRGSLPKKAIVNLRVSLHGTGEAQARTSKEEHLHSMRGYTLAIDGRHEMGASATALEVAIVPSRKEGFEGMPSVIYHEH